MESSGTRMAPTLPSSCAVAAEPGPPRRGGGQGDALTVRVPRFYAQAFLR
jgi:hypothetical protein